MKILTWLIKLYETYYTFVSDKRKAKVIVCEVKDTNEDTAFQQITSYKVGRSTLRFDAPIPL